MRRFCGANFTPSRSAPPRCPVRSSRKSKHDQRQTLTLNDLPIDEMNRRCDSLANMIEDGTLLVCDGDDFDVIAGRLPPELPPLPWGSA
jgi:hypothetical protein